MLPFQRHQFNILSFFYFFVINYTDSIFSKDNDVLTSFI